MKETIQHIIADSIAVKTAILNDEKLISSIQFVAETMIERYKSGKKILFAGNGGSAADAQHLAAELVNRFCFDHDGIPAIALSTDSSIVTSIANDYGYDAVFARQIVAQAQDGDIFVGISTSGNSQNIVQALQACKRKNLFTVGLTGQNGGEMASLCDVCLCVPSTITARIQESHIMIGHILCGLVENALFTQK